MSVPYQDVNILVIEDQRPFLILLKGLLTNLGAKDVMTATNAEQALKTCRAHKVDIIVCDLHLGTNKKNGLELYQELLYRKFLVAGTVFLLISADSARPVVLGSIEHKPDDYLLKPFSQAQLKSRLNKAWQRNKYFLQVLKPLSERNYAGAEQALDELKDVPATYQRTMIEMRTEVLWAKQDYDGAQQLLTSQTEFLPTQWSQLALGKTYLAKRQFEDAINCANKVLALNQFDPEALDILAQARSALKQPEEALESIRLAVKYSPFSMQRQQLANQLARDNKDYSLLIESSLATWQLSKNTIFKRISYWCNHITSLLDAAEAAETKTQRHRYQQEALLQLQRASHDEAMIRIDEPFSLDIFDQLVQARVDAIDGKLIDAKRLLMESQLQLEEQFEQYPGALVPSSVQVMLDLGEYDEANQLLSKIRDQKTDLDDNTRRLIRQYSKQVNEGEQKYTHINRRGIQLYQQNKYEDAKAAFNSALSLSPVNAGIALNLLQCLVKLIEQDDNKNPALRKEAKQTYKILSHAPMRKHHQSKLDDLQEDLKRFNIT